MEQINTHLVESAKSMVVVYGTNSQCDHVSEGGWKGIGAGSMLNYGSVLGGGPASGTTGEGSGTRGGRRGPEDTDSILDCDKVLRLNSTTKADMNIMMNNLDDDLIIEDI